MERLADAQLARYGNNPPADWVAGAFYAGLARLTHVSSRQKYREAAPAIADKQGWESKVARSTGGLLAEAVLIELIEAKGNR
jgi:hypothetical protein